MTFSLKFLPYTLAAFSLGGRNGGNGGGLADAQSTDNIDGVHTVYSGDHYADCTGLFCFSGPNWGDNGQLAWYVKVTFSQSAASYGGSSCFANTVEYYDWNKLWGKARCGYSHPHQQDSDRFVWRRLQDLHAIAPNCGGVANCTGIQLGTYSYDAGTTPYPNENWALSKTFSTILQPDVTYALGMESRGDGTVVHSLFAEDWTLLESKTNVHFNLCANYEQGSVLGLYFGGTCTAPEDISVVYEAAGGPPTGPGDGPSWEPSGAPMGSPSSTPTVVPAPTLVPTKSPSAAPTIPAPTSAPSKSPTFAPTIPDPTSSPTKSPSAGPTSRPVTGSPTACSDNANKGDCQAAGCRWVNKGKSCRSASNTTPPPTPPPTPSGGPGACNPQGTLCSAASAGDCCSKTCGTKGKWANQCK